jgi:conjugative transfer signal peptidase TraF
MVERRDLPLFAWGETLRAARAKRKVLRQRAGLVLIGIGLLGVTIAVPPRPWLVWNASASAPIGLYLVLPGTRLERGDMAIAWLAEPARSLAARRHYLPYTVPLVKRVAAVPGDTICARGSEVLIGDRLRLIRSAHDAQGRPLPAWQGCVTLKDGAVFLAMADSPHSFDGRYFGPTSQALIMGRAVALWVR